jgi:hypothetical protein
MSDRLKQAWKNLQGIDPLIQYRCLYRGKVIAQSGDLQKVSVRPFDDSVPDMADIPIRHGIPGAKVQVENGCTIQIGWDDGQPDKPFAALWSAEASAMRVIFVSPSLELGIEQPPDYAFKGTSENAAIGQFLDALDTYASAIQVIADPLEFATTRLVTASATLRMQLQAALSTRVRIG